MARKTLEPWKREEGFSFARDLKPALITFLVMFTLCCLLSAGVSLSRSSIMDMAMNQYLFNKAEPDTFQRHLLAAAVHGYARIAASRELLFLFISLLTSWTSSTAAYYFLESRDGNEYPPLRGDITKIFHTLRSAATLVLAYGFVLEMAVILLLQNTGSSPAFLAAAVIVASVFRILSFSLGTILGQALAMSAIDGEGDAGIHALRRPLQLLIIRSPQSGYEIPV